ncbi:MAG: hypothetical protein C0402_10000 [Thermodesulfovibrio sp.]|nr:hypothetical protein [Thermodesulfovibrio sp.]
MRVCIDTTVLIDILRDEFPDSQQLLYTALERHEVLISPVLVVAELMPQFSGDMPLLHSFLEDHQIITEPLDVQSVTIAGIRWMNYLKRKSKVICHECGAVIDRKEYVLADFYIGGFALNRCDAIITRDRGVYKKYYPDLKTYEQIAKSAQ